MKIPVIDLTENVTTVVERGPGSAPLTGYLARVEAIRNKVLELCGNDTMADATPALMSLSCELYMNGYRKAPGARERWIQAATQLFDQYEKLFSEVDDE